MNYQRDNEIARDIISGKIKELYCLKTSSLHTFSQKYKVWADKHYNPNQTNRNIGVIHNEYIMKIYIECNGLYSPTGRMELEQNSNISDYFETSLKRVRKEKLNKIKYGN